MLTGKGKLFVKGFPFPVPLPFQKLWVDGGGKEIKVKKYICIR